MRCEGKTKTNSQCKNTQDARFCHLHTRKDDVRNDVRMDNTRKVRFNFLDDNNYQPQMYCGTDLLLPEDYDIFGTRNKCLRKGVGIGMGASDTKRNKFMLKPYIPPPTKLYCGDKTELPEGYSGFGSLVSCLKKGVGAGLIMDQTKRLAFQSKPKPPLGKKELITLAQRLGIQNVNVKTRDAVEREISRKIKP